MWCRLRECFFLSKRQSCDRLLLVKASASTGAVGHTSIGFRPTWSKCPLSSISECDEDVEWSVLSVITESDDNSDQQVEHEHDQIRTVPDFTTVCTSSRFFFTAPGSSSSIIERQSTPALLPSSALLLQPAVKVARNSLAVETYSASPYQDFKKSMLEMVEASRLMKKDTASRWSFLHEMLLCYLTLNHNSTHKLIISAFADLLLNLVVVDNGEVSRENPAT